MDHTHKTGIMDNEYIMCNQFQGYTMRIWNILVTFFMIVTKCLASTLRKEGFLPTLSPLWWGKAWWMAEAWTGWPHCTLCQEREISMLRSPCPPHSSRGSGLSTFSLCLFAFVNCFMCPQRYTQGFVSMAIIKSSQIGNQDEPPQGETEH